MARLIDQDYDGAGNIIAVTIEDDGHICEFGMVRHGRWIHATTEDSDWGGTFHRYTCSACNWSMGDNPTGWGLFCPHCGAKMDGETKDDG